jgi:hypothetical protein
MALLAVYLLGQWAAELVVQRLDPGLHGPGDWTLQGLVMAASGVYVALMALPFMPAAEVGLGMIALFGAKVCWLVYLCTVVALLPPYLAGRVIPPEACARAFGFVGLAKARRLMERIAPLSAERRLAHLLDHAPSRLGPLLVRHRFLSLALVLNLPGNMIVGGGGGIALVAGMSGLFPLPAYLATIAVAVAPIPLMIALSGLGT